MSDDQTKPNDDTQSEDKGCDSCDSCPGCGR